MHISALFSNVHELKDMRTESSLPGQPLHGFSKSNKGAAYNDNAVDLLFANPPSDLVPPIIRRFDRNLLYLNHIPLRPNGLTDFVQVKEPGKAFFINTEENADPGNSPSKIAGRRKNQLILLLPLQPSKESRHAGGCTRALDDRFGNVPR